MALVVYGRHSLYRFMVRAGVGLRPSPSPKTIIPAARPVLHRLGASAPDCRLAPQLFGRAVVCHARFAAHLDRRPHPGPDHDF